MIATWPCPGPGGIVQELAITFDRARDRRVMFVAALFDEANRTRRFMVETMRRLDTAGIDCFLPDLPGLNESPQSFAHQTLAGWRESVRTAAAHFRAQSVFTLRGGSLLLPPEARAIVLEPISGMSLLRQQLRARTVAAREEGRHETIDDLLAEGRQKGLNLNGYPISAALSNELVEARWEISEKQLGIAQSQLGGGALWLRAEPSEDPAQADALALLITGNLPA